MANYPTFPITPRAAPYNFTTSDSTSDINIATGGDNGTRITSLILHNKPTTAREVYVSLTDGTNTVRLAAASVNNTGNTTQELLTTCALQQDAQGNNYVVLPSNGWSLAVGLNAAVGTTNDVSVTAFGADY